MTANARSGSRTRKKCVVPATSIARRSFGRRFTRPASTGRVAMFDIASKLDDQWNRRRRAIRGTNTRRPWVIQSRPSIGQRPWASVVCVANHCATGASSRSAFGSRTGTGCPIPTWSANADRQLCTRPQMQRDHVVLTIRTEHGALCATLLGTLPRTRPAPRIPLLPTTIRSAPTSSATRRIAATGSSGSACV